MISKIKNWLQRKKIKNSKNKHGTSKSVSNIMLDELIYKTSIRDKEKKQTFTNKLESTFKNAIKLYKDKIDKDSALNGIPLIAEILFAEELIKFDSSIMNKIPQLYNTMLAIYTNIITDEKSRKIIIGRINLRLINKLLEVPPFMRENKFNALIKEINKDLIEFHKEKQEAIFSKFK